MYAIRSYYAAHDLAENLRKNKFEKDISPDEIKEFIATDIASKIAPYAKGLEIDTSKKPFVIRITSYNVCYTKLLRSYVISTFSKNHTATPNQNL